MFGKSIYEQIDGKDFESRNYRFRSTEEFDLEHEERQLAIKLLRRRDDILNAVHLFSERFLSPPALFQKKGWQCIPGRNIRR